MKNNNPPECISSRDTFRESELVEELIRLLPAFFKLRTGDWYLEKELGVGKAIADVVVLLAPKYDCEATPQNRLTVAESVVLASLRHSGRTRIDLLERRCGLPRGGLRNRTLSRLHEWGVLVESCGGIIEISSKWAKSSHIIAIEAKLTKWRSALHQAVAYRRYADTVYVALPAARAEAAVKANHEFKAEGIGLLVVSHGHLKTVIEPAPSKTHDWRRDFVYSRLVTGRDKYVS